MSASDQIKASQLREMHAIKDADVDAAHEIAIRDERDNRYHARAWRTKLLRRAAAEEVVRIVTAFIPEGFHVDLRRNQLVCQPDGTSRVWPVTAVLRARDPEGSDAHIAVNAETVQGAYAKLLAVILDGGGFFPLT